MKRAEGHTFTALGKEVLCDGEHHADATCPEDAERIARLLNGSFPRAAALASAALCLSGFIGEGISIEGHADPLDVYGRAMAALNMPEGDDDDLIALLKELEGKD